MLIFILFLFCIQNFEMGMNTTSNGPIEGSSQFFGWLDFVFFLALLALSTIIGIYFGFWGKKEETPKEYLHGGKTMSTLPVAASMICSYLSGVAMMGYPSEMYRFGTLCYLVIIGEVIMGFITYYFYLPVFYGLGITSTYEYLELRFKRSVRVMASVLYTISLLLNQPIVVYVPALVLSQVSGVNLHIIAIGTSILCIFYTMVGMVMIVSSVAVIVLGLIHAGGFGEVWRRNEEGGRIHFIDFNPSPIVRMTLWSVIIGSVFNALNWVAVNQSMVQRFVSVPTFKKAGRSLVYCVIGIMLIKTILCFIGLLVYSAYYNCDPIQSKAISRPDQLASYYVMDIASWVPGLPGLFVAGIFSAALSTMSSNLNSLGATLFEDFIRPHISKSVSDEKINKIIKVVVTIIGGICLLFVFIVDKFANILQLALSTNGVTSGAMLGLFTFGILFPRGNTKGILAGSVTSLLTMSWIIYKAQEAITDGRFKQPTLPTSIEGCGFNITLSGRLTNETIVNEEPQEEIFILYRISFMYYTVLGFLITIVVAAIVSYFTEPPPPEKLKPTLFAPFVRRFLKTPDILTNDPAEKEMGMNITTNGPFEGSSQFFGWLDFVFFLAMLALSTIIGIYFGFWGKKEETPKEYLHGGKTMSTLPVAASMICSYLSGVAMMGYPSEMYRFGTLCYLVIIGEVIMGFITYYFYLPVFYGLGITSTYEGGLKAVVWTDFLQGMVMIVSSAAVIVLGLIHAGGFGEVWRRNEEGGRIHFIDFNPSPIVRMTLWSVIIGSVFNALNWVAVNQSMVQRFVSVPTFKKAGSTMSSNLNSLGATLFEDFVRPHISKSVSDEKINKIIKVVVTIIGGICLLFVFIVDKFANILQLTLSTNGVTSGAMLGLFTFGILFPRGNTKGILVGSITSLLTMSWIIYKAQEAITDGRFIQPTLPTSIEGCGFNVTLSGRLTNETRDNELTEEAQEEIFILYRISFMYYTVLGLLITIVVAAIVSYFTEPPPPEKLKPALFAPFVRRFLKTPDKLTNDPAGKELMETQPMFFTMNGTEAVHDVTSHLYFGWIDFLLFGLMLGGSAMIGVYFGCWEKKLDTRVDYLFGGKTMNTLPVAVSLVASHFSGITLMGVPAEVFYFGTLYWLVNVSSVVVTLIINFIYLPLFYELQLTSTYEGGLKAVVWIDFLQSFVIIISSIAIIILGVMNVGGMGTVWNKSVEGGRLNMFDMNPSPLVRATFWNVIIGNIFSWMNYCAVNQGMVQKFLALPSLTKAKQALGMFTIGIFIIKTISCYTGLIVYATYDDCDPLKSKAIQRQDQLVPYYIMDIAGSIPGLPGLFIAGVFSAALSSMSSNLNSMAATMYEDFIQPCMRRKISEKTASYIIRFVVLLIGVICVLMVFVVERLGGILQLAYTTGGVTSGAFLGIFSLGIFFPRANAKGAIAGAVVSLLTLGWIAVGAQRALALGQMKHMPLPTSQS
ncbi:hypothetical protein C0J52_18975 [Blattella germanica]|nr:hypothetical protein C0J52_18975 [Blattella germanica]